MAGLPAKQLEFYACGELSAQLRNYCCGGVLFFRVRGPTETEALSGVAGDQYCAGKGRKRWKAGRAAGVERRPRAAGRGGCFGRVSAGLASGESESGACQSECGRCPERGGAID